MQRQRRRARVDQSRPELERGTRAVVNATPKLHGHGDVHGVRDRADDRARAIRILEQVRASTGLGDLLHRATEVDVDDVGADRLDHARTLGHRPRLRPEQLDGQGVLVGGDAEVPESLLVAVLDPGAADHLEQTSPAP